MKKPIPIILFLLQCFCLPSSHGADTLRVGHPILEGAVLPLGTTTRAGFRIHQGVRTPMNRSVQTIELTDEGGLPVYRVSNLHWTADGSDTTRTTIFIRRDNLALIRHKVKAKSDSAAVLYSHGFLSGWVVLPDEPIQLIDMKVAHAVFPVDGPAPWFIGALPLGEKFSAVIPRYSMWKEREVYEEVHVIGKETIDRDGRRMECWKVDNGPFAIPGYRAYHWVDKGTGEIIQSVLRGGGDEPEYWSFTD